MGKRGMSQIVTTILIILLVIVVIGIIWGVISAFVNRGVGSISLDKFTLDLKIKSAKLNYSTGIATVRVVRNSGEGDLVTIKFVVEDDRNSEIFEESALNFYELAERTYDLDLNSREFLNIGKVRKISIAPVYISSSNGEETLGGITDFVSGEDLVTSGDVGDIPVNDSDTTGFVCEVATDCGIDSWLEGTLVCSETGNNVMQYKKTYSCVLGFCDMSTDSFLKESCGDASTCYNGVCIEEEIPCSEVTVESDCGIDSWVGLEDCSIDSTATIQDWQSYRCVDSICVSSVESLRRIECIGEEVCFQGECFVPLDCAQNSDCSIGEICSDGECVPEEVVVSGYVRSAWPFGVGEYFDSPDLPLTRNPEIVAYHIIFPENPNVGCLEIVEFSEPAIADGISYVRLKPLPTGVVDNDYFEVWETDYACTLI